MTRKWVIDMARQKVQVSGSNRGGALVQSALCNGRQSVVPGKTASAKTYTIPKEVVVVGRAGVKRVRVKGLLDSMDLDEMLEASKNIEIGLRGEKIPSISSSNVQKYVNEVLTYNKMLKTKRLSQRMQQELTKHIIDVNKKTIDARKANNLYQALMKEKI